MEALGAAILNLLPPVSSPSTTDGSSGASSRTTTTIATTPSSSPSTTSCTSSAPTPSVTNPSHQVANVISIRENGERVLSPSPNQSHRSGVAMATTLVDMMLSFFWKNIDKNKRSDIYDALTLKYIRRETSSEHRMKGERRFRKYVFDLVSKTFPWVINVENIRMCVSDQRSILPIEIMIPRRAAYSTTTTEMAYVGRVLFDNYKSVVDPHGHIAYIVSRHPKISEEYPMFWSYVFLHKIPAYSDCIDGSWSDELSLFSTSIYLSGWLNSDAIAMLANGVDFSFKQHRDDVTMGVKAMYNFQLLSASYNDDYLFTAAVLRNAYKFAYTSCLYVPRSITSVELRSLHKREVLFGVRSATVSDVIQDVNNLPEELARKRENSLPTKIRNSIECAVKATIPHMCESINIPSVITNALVSACNTPLLQIIREINVAFFQHRDWEERINRKLKSIPSLMNNISQIPLIIFKPNKSSYTPVNGDVVIELPGFDQSITLTTYIDNDTRKRMCPLKYILQEPFIFLNKGSGKYFLHSSDGHPMPLTQVEGLRILYHFSQ